MSLESEARDQILHIIAGAAFVIGARLLGADIPPIAGAFIAFQAGIVREVTEWLTWNREVGKYLRPRVWRRYWPTIWANKVDLLFWTIGGLGGTFNP